MFENSDAVSFATNGEATYHYSIPMPSGATLKTDGEKIVGRVEAPAFKVGSVYRQRGGKAVRLTDECTGAHLAKWQRELPGHSFAQMRDVASHEPAGYCSLIDGRYVAHHQVEDSRSHLLPGELVQRDGQWVAMEEAKPASRTPEAAFDDAVRRARESFDLVTNVTMVARDDRQPTSRERSVMARINLAKSLAADWEAAKKQPAPAHPYPFARNFQG